MNTPDSIILPATRFCGRVWRTSLTFLTGLACLVLGADHGQAAAFTWNIQTAGGAHPTLAFDSAGQPAIAFGNQYTVFNGSTWSTAQDFVPANQFRAGGKASLAFNPITQKPQIAFATADNLLRLATLDGSWSVEAVNSVDAFFDPVNRCPNLAIDATGKAHIGWGQFAGGNADYAYSTKENGEWVTVTFESGPGSRFAAEYSSLTLNNSGVPAIIYNSLTNGGPLFQTRYIVRTGGEWTTPEPAIVDVPAPCGALKFDQNNVAHIAYYDEDTVKYATRAANGSWSAESVATFSSSERFSLSLAIHPVTGVPYITFRDQISENNAAVKVAHKTSGSWEVETIATGLGIFRTSTEINASGTVLGVAYDGKYASAAITTELTITTGATLPGGTLGRAYSRTFERFNGTANFSWSKVSGNFPDGLNLNQTTGELSGTPTTANQNSSFRLRVTDGLNVTAEKDFTLSISAAPSITSNATLPAGNRALAYSQTLAAAGGSTPLKWTVLSGTLPTGLALNEDTGILSGTPEVANTFNFTVLVTDANGATANKAFSLTINNALAITETSPIPAATAGRAYNRTIAANGGTGTLVWSLVDSTLPTGLSLNGANGLISGTTAMSGTVNFTVKVTDANNAMVTREFALTVNEAPVVTTTMLPEATVSIAYSYQMLGAGGTSPRTWSKTGNLPAGLTLSGAGLIAGTPTASGTFNLTLRLTDQNGAFAERALTLNVLAAPQGPNLAAGQTLHSQRCAGCHNLTSFTPRAGASKLILDYKGNHQNGAISALADSARTNLAFYISSLDTTTYIINGEVKDGAGQPVEGATVTATSGYLPMRSAVSAANGAYSITGLAPGDYVLRASKPSVTFAPASVPLAVTLDKYVLGGNVAYTPNVQPLVPAINFTANRAPIVTLTSPVNNLSYAAPAAILLTATASDPDGTVAKVEFYADGQFLGANLVAPAVFTWNTGTAGTNILTAVATDNLGLNTTSAPVTIYVLTSVGVPGVSLASGQAIYDAKCASCHGGPPGGNSLWNGLAKNGHPLIAASRYQIKPGVVAYFPQHFGAASNYVNHVMTDADQSNLAAYIASQAPRRFAVAGTVRNAAGQGLAGAAVAVRSLSNPGVTAFTDATGKFRVEGLPPGDYTLSAALDTYDPFSPQSHDVKTYPGELTEYPWQVLINGYRQQGFSATDLNFTQGFLLSGTVRNANGKGFAGVGITVNSSTSYYTTATGVTGPNGDYSLVVTNDSYLVWVGNVQDYAFNLPNRSATVSGGPLSGVDFTVTAAPALTISGKVTDPSGAGLNGVTVSLAEAPGITTTTDANGDYSLTSPDPGTFTVTVAKANHLFTPVNRSVSVGVGSKSGVNFTGLLNSFNITGTIRTPTTFSGPPFFNAIPGEPIANVAVSVPGQTVYTDAAGTYRLVLTNNTYTITAERNGYAFDSATRGITVNGADQSGQDFTAGLLVAYASLSGNNNNDGASWNSPKLSIQKAINITAKGGQVWVSGGVYYERIVFSGISLYGVGKPVLNGLPLPFGEQFPRGRMVEIDTSTGIGTNSTRLDGFTIINGLANSPNTGGGIYCKATDSEAGPVVIANNSIGYNYAAFKGGGIFLFGKATVTNNVISHNQTGSGGGAGIQVDFGSDLVTIANNLIVANSADNGGGGIGTFAGSILIANNTIAENIVTNSGAGGIYFGAGFGSSTNANNIIAFNSSGLGTVSSVVLNRNNCVFGNTNANYDVLTPGTGDVSVDPQLANPAEFNYRLLATSPLLNAGFNDFLVGPADLDAAPRREGANVDIGAYEYQEPNTPPAVALITPVHQASYSAPASFTLNAVAVDIDGTVAKVEFYAGALLLGSATTAPYAYSLNGLQIGSHQLTAVVTDNRGATSVSEPITVTVHPLTDPTVAITIPVEGTRLAAPAQLTLTATAADSNGSITKVEFFADGVKLGEDISAPYAYAWANVGVGTYTLTAKATDNSGATRISTPVSVTVIDAPQIQQTDTVYTGGEFRLPMQLQAGRSYLIQASSDLITWTTLETFTALGNAVEYVDTQAGSFPGRFYRLVQLD